MRNILITNRMLSKDLRLVIFISFILIAFIGCASKSDEQNIFFKKYYTNPDKTGCLNIFIYKDTMFKNRNTYSATNNYLEYLVLNTKEKETLKNILMELADKNVKSSYKKGNYDYTFYWEVSGENLETEVLDNINPEALKPLYDFILRRSEVSKRSIKRINSSIYNSININSINEIGDSNINYPSNVKKDKVLYLIWHQLARSKHNYFFDIDDISDFNYEVKFSYLINTRNKPIEKIYLNKLGTLAIKFRDSTRYKGLNLTHIPF